MASTLAELQWIEDRLPDNHQRRKMFGGFAYYIDEKLMLVIFEAYGNKQYRGQKFEYEIWNGCMFPVEKNAQTEVLQLFPFLMNHPVLPKWLYLPTESEDFENNAEAVLKEIRRRNILFGTIPKQKKQKRPKKEKKSSEKVNMRRPQMFREDSAVEVLQQAKRLSDLKNFGPETEKALINAGIKTAPQFIKMGWKKALEQLCVKSPKYAHSIFTFAMIGALKNQMWNLISEEDKAEAKMFTKELRLRINKNLRKSKTKKKKK